jgi:hypothetical protein
MIGATGQGIDFAKTKGTSSLVAALKSHGSYPVTDPARQSLVEN